MTPARLITTVGGIGTLPWAPGTWGSAAAIPFTWILHWLGGAPLVVAATALVFVIGWWATNADPRSATDDPGEIVIDEVAGQMIALWPLSIGLWLVDHPPHLFPWPGWIGAFTLFRFFDVLKPPPIRWVDRPGALWIMLDDVLAGALAAIVITIAAGVSHGWF